MNLDGLYKTALQNKTTNFMDSCIDPKKLSEDLFEKEIIPDHLFNKIIDPNSNFGTRDRLQSLFEYLLQAVEKKGIFIQVLQILKDEGGTNAPALAKLLEERFEELVTKRIEENKEQLLQPYDDHVFTEITVVTEGVSLDLLSSHFQMTFGDVAKIKDEIKEHEGNKALALLRKWRCQKKENTSYLALLKPFVEMNNIAVVEVIVEHIKNHSINETKHLQHPFTPEATPDKYRTWNDLSHVEKEQIKNELREENEKTKYKYASVVVNIVRLFKERNVDYEEIKMFLHLSVKPMSTNELDDLDRADSMNKVFFFICKHTSWFNFEILEEVVKTFGGEVEKELLSNYISGTLTPYLKRSIFEIPPDSFPSQSDHSICSLVCLKLPDDLQPSGNDIKLIQVKLAKRIGINPSNLQLRFYESGCIELNFEIQNVWLNDDSTSCKINEIVESNDDKYNVTLDIISVLLPEENLQDEVELIKKIVQQKDNKIIKMTENIEYDDEEYVYPNTPSVDSGCGDSVVIAPTKSTLKDKQKSLTPPTVDQTSFSPLKHRQLMECISGLIHPRYVAINKSYVVVTEYFDDKVTILNRHNNQMFSFGDGKYMSLECKSASKLSSPTGVALINDCIVVIDGGNHSVRLLTIDGRHIATVGTYGSSSLQFKSPEGVAVNSITNTIYISDCGNNRIQVLNPNLSFHSLLYVNDMKPYGLAMDSNTGILYVTDDYYNCIHKLSTKTKLSYISSFPCSKSPAGIALGEQCLFISDHDRHQISKFTLDGVPMEYYGKYGTDLGKFKYPFGLAHTESGDLYICDSDNDRVQIW